MTNLAIAVKDVSKVYHLYNNPADRLKESIHPFGKKYHQEYYALRNVSFELRRGETLGIIGKNGSGKSTLLKIISGVLTPTTGTVEVNGKIAALLELGAGFNMEFTGIENIYMSGTIMGYSKAEMDAKLDEVVAFADIGDYIHQPVKMYSSGMFARLAFAVNSSVNPDILIVDEALSVGDMFFQAKCVDKMKRMMDDGVTILFVSHDTWAVKSLCNKGILLDQGKIVKEADADQVVEEYYRQRVQSEQPVEVKQQVPVSEVAGDRKDCFSDNKAFLERAQYQRIQNGKVDFYNIQLLDEDGQEVCQVDYGQKVTLRMAILINEDVDELAHGYHIRSSTGVDLIFSDSVLENKMLHNLKSGEKYIIDYQFAVSLMQGIYNLSCGMSRPLDLTVGKVDVCDFVPCAVQFTVRTVQGRQLYGYVHWENKVEIEKC